MQRVFVAHPRRVELTDDLVEAILALSLGQPFGDLIGSADQEVHPFGERSVFRRVGLPVPRHAAIVPGVAHEGLARLLMCLALRLRDADEAELRDEAGPRAERRPVLCGQLLVLLTRPDARDQEAVAPFGGI